MKYKYALFVRKSLRKENVAIFNSMFIPLNLNYDHNTRAAINHLLDIPQKQTCHYGTYSMVFTASKISNNILRKSNKHLLYCHLSAFKKTIFQRFLSKYEIDNWTDWVLFSKTAIHGGYYNCSFCILLPIFDIFFLFYILHLFIYSYIFLHLYIYTYIYIYYIYMYIYIYIYMSFFSFSFSTPFSYFIYLFIYLSICIYFFSFFALFQYFIDCLIIHS